MTQIRLRTCTEIKRCPSGGIPSVLDPGILDVDSVAGLGLGGDGLARHHADMEHPGREGGGATTNMAASGTDTNTFTDTGTIHDERRPKASISVATISLFYKATHNRSRVSR